jgi:hypothetical protein
METIAIFVVLVAALGALAVRFGSDSRSGAYSPEQAYAELGFRWENTLPEFLRTRARSWPRPDESWFRKSRGSSWFHRFHSVCRR